MRNTLYFFILYIFNYQLVNGQSVSQSDSIINIVGKVILINKSESIDSHNFDKFDLILIKIDISSLTCLTSKLLVVRINSNKNSLKINDSYNFAVVKKKTHY